MDLGNYYLKMCIKNFNDFKNLGKKTFSQISKCETCLVCCLVLVLFYEILSYLIQNLTSFYKPKF